MTKVWRTILVTALIAFAAGALGVYSGLALFADGRERGHSSLDVAVHRQLNLNTAQEQQIEEIEARFAARKSSLEQEMRAATRDIANAISEDGAYTPRVAAAVERFHAAMGELEHGTILHVFEMRAVITPDQQDKFDGIVRTELLHSTEQPAAH